MMQKWTWDSFSIAKRETAAHGRSRVEAAQGMPLIGVEVRDLRWC
jgi:hypothetical protein